MKTNRKNFYNFYIYIPGALLLAMVLSFYYPIRYHSIDKTKPTLPFYHEYNKVVMHNLPDSVQLKATKNRCKKNISPVQNVKGNVRLLRLFPSLKEDINLAIARYPKWHLRASESERAEMKKRLDENLKMWAGAVNPKILMQTINTQSKNAFGTKYSATAQLLKLLYQKGDNLKLIVKINNVRTQNMVFKVELTFVDPVTLSHWQKERVRKIQKLHAMKNRAQISFGIFLILSAIFILYILFLVIRKIVHVIKEKREKNYLLQEIQKCQELANNGHFVAALQLVERYLQFFPNDSEAVAFKERLLDFTNNDPKKAQVAFVEAEKMKLRLKQVNQDPTLSFLSPDEKDHIKALMPYHQELKNSYLALVSAEENARHQQDLETKIHTLQQLMASGKIFEAEQLLTKTGQDGFESPELLEMAEEIQKKKKTAEEKWENFQRTLLNGETYTLTDTLSTLLKEFPDMPAAISFQANMLRAKGQTRLLLKAQDNEKDIVILCGCEFVLGRNGEEEIPDIAFNDKRVSRQHCRIYLNDGKPFVEDLGSTGGTYLNGDKISRQQLSTGNLINLAKLVNLETTPKNGDTGAIVLSGTNTDYLLLFSSLHFDIQKGTIKPEPSKYSLTFIHNSILFSDHQEAIFLNNGENLIINHHKYTVEANYENR